MKQNRLIVVLICFLILFFSSCKKNVSETVFPEKQQPVEYVFGTPKINPYTVENMQKAYNFLHKKSGSRIQSRTMSINTTHYYVKFKPKNDAQYETLINDKVLELLNIPIEADIIQTGEEYHDPSVPDSIPTYQYTAVPVDYKFNDTIPYEILANLYIPETDSTVFDPDNTIDQAQMNELLDEAYSLTGNYTDTIKITQRIGGRFTPGGRIRVMDTRLQSFIGLEGIDVQARRWFTVYHAKTDANGNYRMQNSFRRPCNYSIWFYEGDDFFVSKRVLVSGIYWINGPKIENDWNFDITDGYARFASHVFRGAYRYYVKDIGGLSRPLFYAPPQPNTKKQKYVASNTFKKGSGVNWAFYPIIKIGRYKDDAQTMEYDSDEIFSTTCHETAHTSLLNRMGGIIQFTQVNAKCRESWAVGVEWYLTHIEYSERGILNYGQANYHIDGLQYPNNNAFQYWTKSISEDYTSLYINLIDDFNEINQWGNTGIPNDEVKSYTFPLIESDFLKDVYGLSSLSRQLKSHKPSGVTDSQIDLLLMSY